MMDAPRILIPLAIVVIAVYSSAFTVGETETAILFRLGEIKRADFKPGLHFKVPLINNVKKFDDRLLSLDFEPQRFLTKEKKDVIVDLFLKWRIVDVAAYYKATGGDERRAGLLVYQRINDRLRGEFGRHTVKEVVSGERGAIMSRVTDAAKQQSGELGLDVVDVRIKQINLPTEVSSAVYNRMRAERERTARDLRSRGAEAGERIRADADRERTQILAEAYRDAQKTRGEGDAKATETYAGAYGKDPEFYAFWGSLGAYREGLKGQEDLLILEPDSEFFKYFNAPEIRDGAQPNASVAAGEK
ncbi:MAG: protease modulator HflC [Gammaproteobacteria bacterium]